MLSWALPASAHRSGKPTATKPTTVRVDAGRPTEYAFVVLPKAVKRGTVVFVVVNDGERAHDFKILGKRTPMLGPGESSRLTVTFAKPGSYAYYCTVAGHAVAGMKGSLKVT